MEMTWHQHQEWEANWWGDCTNTFAEETKQLTYGHKMGLVHIGEDGKWPVWLGFGKKILDIGGGPVSMLLKTENLMNGSVVADPCRYPAWTRDRYHTKGIHTLTVPGEHLLSAYEDGRIGQFDEVWIYNVLQHVMDPAKIIENAWKLAPTIRIFEWVNLPATPGHPHVLKPANLDAWLGGEGTTEDLEENGCVGPAYYGVFSK